MLKWELYTQEKFALYLAEDIAANRGVEAGATNYKQVAVTCYSVKQTFMQIYILISKGTYQDVAMHMCSKLWVKTACPAAHL